MHQYKILKIALQKYKTTVRKNGFWTLYLYSQRMDIMSSALLKKKKVNGQDLEGEQPSHKMESIGLAF